MVSLLPVAFGPHVGGTAQLYVNIGNTVEPNLTVHAPVSRAVRPTPKGHPSPLDIPVRGLGVLPEEFFAGFAALALKI